MSAALAPDRILKELGELWASLGEANEESHGVVRACAMTLLIFTADEDAESAAQILAEVIREHPNRAVVVRVGAVALGHQLRAQCWMPFGRRQQLCCEHIEITAGPRDLAGLATLLRALAAPDLPLVLWFRGRQMYEFPWPGADKVIVDSSAAPDPPAMLDRLARASGGSAIGDLAWTRLTRWREIIAQAFENNTAQAALDALSEVRISHGGPNLPAEAWYLAAWILGAVGSDAGVRFERLAGTAGIQAVEMAGTGFSARRSAGAAVEVSTTAGRYCTACPDRAEAALLREELALPGRDPIYDNALRLAARLASRGEGG